MLVRMLMMNSPNLRVSMVRMVMRTPRLRARMMRVRMRTLIRIPSLRKRKSFLRIRLTLHQHHHFMKKKSGRTERSLALPQKAKLERRARLNL
jgi:molybdopterin biosynthesis enzyme